jgi:putative AlgH/UPF0301 family transcriptional regulator
MIDPASGILLIADPFLKDPNFLRTVVLLCEHQTEGSFGFVLNRPIQNTLDELIPELRPFPRIRWRSCTERLHFSSVTGEIPGGRNRFGVFQVVILRP